MYVRFERPPSNDDGTDKTVTSKHGLLRARAIIGPVNPFLKDCEIRNFGLWSGSDNKIKLTMPQANAGFLVLAPRGVLSIVKAESEDGETDGQTTTTTMPSKAGETQIDRLSKLILAAWDATTDDNRYTKRHDLPLGDAPSPSDGAIKTAPTTTTQATPQPSTKK